MNPVIKLCKKTIDKTRETFLIMFLLCRGRI